MKKLKKIGLFLAVILLLTLAPLISSGGILIANAIEIEGQEIPTKYIGRQLIIITNLPSFKKNGENYEGAYLQLQITNNGMLEISLQGIKGGKLNQERVSPSSYTINFPTYFKQRFEYYYDDGEDVYNLDIYYISPNNIEFFGGQYYFALNDMYDDFGTDEWYDLMSDYTRRLGIGNLIYDWANEEDFFNIIFKQNFKYLAQLYYQSGQEYGNEQGYVQGYADALNSSITYQRGYADGREEGILVGYEQGLSAGQSQTIHDLGLLGWISGIFASMNGFLGISIGGVTIGQIALVPLAISLCFGIIRLIRGGGY